MTFCPDLFHDVHLSIGGKTVKYLSWVNGISIAVDRAWVSLFRLTGGFTWIRYYQGNLVAVNYQFLTHGASLACFAR